MTLSAPSGAEAFRRVSRVYHSPRLFGAGAIVRDHLGLGEDEPLPLTIPHGVDIYINFFDLDVEMHEPLYLATRPDIAERVARYKPVLPFPHPWLLMRQLEGAPRPEGTLFIALPPSNGVFEQMLAAIEAGDFPKPWAILMKERGLATQDSDWWASRGFAVHSAGAIDNPRFYYNLREIMARYAVVGAPNLSSAVIFAAAMGRRARPLPDIVMEVVDQARVAEGQDLADSGGNVRRIWSNLFSADQDVARAQAMDLLGARYLDTPEALRGRYDAAVAALDRAVHLHPLRPGLVHAILQWLVALGIPLDRLFPDPWARIAARLARFFGRDRLAIIRGSDVTHYGLAPGRNRLSIEVVPRRQIGPAAEPGHAVRAQPTSAAPIADA